MSNLRQAAQMALQALEGWEHCDKWVWPATALEQAKRNTTESFAALRTALAEPEQVHKDIRALKYRIHELEGEVMGYKRMLDVAEAASQQKPLTDDQIAKLYMSHTDRPMKAYWEFARAIEAAHGIKGKA